MVDCTRKFKKKFATLAVQTKRKNMFTSLAETTHSSQFISGKIAKKAPILVHVVGFYPLASQPARPIIFMPRR